MSSGWADAAGLAIRASRSIFLAVLSLGVVIGLWYGALAILNLSPYYAKNPADVWTYLTSGDTADANRAELWHELGTTLRDAGVGYVAGSTVGLLTAIAIVLSPTVELSVMPILVALQTIPIVAMTPLIALTFGRGLLAVAVIGTIVTFFPTVVYVVRRMRTTPTSAVDLVHAYGGGPWIVLRKLQLPNAVPAIFAAARVAVPASIVAAMLAEWLATGRGIGYLILAASSASRFDTMWSAVAIITIVSVFAYTTVTIIEAAVLNRYEAG